MLLLSLILFRLNSQKYLIYLKSLNVCRNMSRIKTGCVALRWAIWGPWINLIAFAFVCVKSCLALFWLDRHHCKNGIWLGTSLYENFKFSYFWLWLIYNNGYDCDSYHGHGHDHDYGQYRGEDNCVLYDHGHSLGRDYHDMTTAVWRLYDLFDDNCPPLLVWWCEPSAKSLTHPMVLTMKRRCSIWWSLYDIMMIIIS